MAGAELTFLEFWALMGAVVCGAVCAALIADRLFSGDEE